MMTPLERPRAVCRVPDARNPRFFRRFRRTFEVALCALVNACASPDAPIDAAALGTYKLVECQSAAVLTPPPTSRYVPPCLAGTSNGSLLNPRRTILSGSFTLTADRRVVWRLERRTMENLVETTVIDAATTDVEWSGGTATFTVKGKTIVLEWDGAREFVWTTNDHVVGDLYFRRPDTLQWSGKYQLTRCGRHYDYDLYIEFAPPCGDGVSIGSGWTVTLDSAFVEFLADGTARWMFGRTQHGPGTNVSVTIDEDEGPFTANDDGVTLGGQTYSWNRKDWFHIRTSFALDVYLERAP